MSRFLLDPQRSVILLSVRSTVGPLEFGGADLQGVVETQLSNDMTAPEGETRAHVELRVSDLRSGNQLYDAELLRRIDAKRFPVALIDLLDAVGTGVSGRYQLQAQVTFHGVQRLLSGPVSVSILNGRRLIVDGEQTLDIRDFDVPVPKMLMLRIFPDVRVQLHVEADAATP